MKRTSRPHLLRGLLVVLGLAIGTGSIAGCGGSPDAPESPAMPDGGAETQDDHDHDGDHDSAAGHVHDDHPPHGPNGGHLLGLDDGEMEVEVAFREDDNQVIVHFSPEAAESVTKVEMRYQVEDQEPMTFELTPDESLGEHAYQVASPELLTAVQIGEAAGVQLIVTTPEGESTGDVTYVDH